MEARRLPVVPRIRRSPCPRLAASETLASIDDCRSCDWPATLQLHRAASSATDWLPQRHRAALCIVSRHSTVIRQLGGAGARASSKQEVRADGGCIGAACDKADTDASNAGSRPRLLRARTKRDAGRPGRCGSETWTAGARGRGSTPTSHQRERATLSKNSSRGCGSRPSMQSTSSSHRRRRRTDRRQCRSISRARRRAAAARTTARAASAPACGRVRHRARTVGWSVGTGDWGPRKSIIGRATRSGAGAGARLAGYAG